MISKVCIVTNYRNTGNYGAVLQAYALNKKISDMGFICETLDFNVQKRNRSKVLRYLKRIKAGELKSLVEDLKRDISKALVRKEIFKRRQALNRFKDRIPHTKFYTYNQLHEISGLYDCYICGSDQIWRPTFEGSLIGIYWLDGINGNCVKASYAASMGIASLPENLLSEAKGYLESFDYISVREKTAQEYLSSLTEKKIEVSIDPVFLIHRKDWETMAKHPIGEDSYIFVYMIHGSRNLFRSITDFASLHKLKIVTFPYMAYHFRMEEMNFGDVKIFDAEPSDFLGYVNGAKYIFTDSFHATAFSIIFHKNFFVSSANEKAFSRIKNLLDVTRLDERSIPAEGLAPENYGLDVQTDWQGVDQRLELIISDSLNYLNIVLGK